MRTKRVHFVMLLLVIGFGMSGNLATEVRAQSSSPISEPEMKLGLAGYVPPAAKHIAIQGTYAYLGCGPALTVVSIADPAQPRQLAYRLMQGEIQELNVTGTRAYALLDGNRLQVIDIGIPTQPQLLGLYASATSLYGLGVKDFYVLLNSQVGMQVLDVSNPWTPKLIQINASLNGANDLVVAGNRAYQNTGTGIRVIDVTNPTNMKRLGEITLTGGSESIFDISVSGNIIAAAVDSPNGELRIILADVSDPAHLTKLSELDGLGSGTYFYFTCLTAYHNKLGYGIGNMGFHLIDITDPKKPIVEGMLNGGEMPNDAVINEYHVFLAGGASGLVVNNLTSFSLQSKLEYMGLAADVVAAQGQLFVTDGSSDQVIRLNPGTIPPDLIATAVQASKVRGMRGSHLAAEGERLYLTSSGCINPKYHMCDRVLKAFLVIWPVAPNPLGSAGLPKDFTSAPSTPGRIAASGNQVYVADGTYGLHVIDFTQPMTPTKITTYAVGGNLKGVAIQGDNAFVADEKAGLRVIDVSNPISPTQTNLFEFFDSQNVTISGTLAYVANGINGVQLLDISDVQNIQALGSLDTPGRAEAIAVDGRYAYVASGPGGLVLLDISDPQNPKLLDQYDTPGEANGVALAGGYVYLSSGTGGLFIFRMVNPRAYLPLVGR